MAALKTARGAQLAMLMLIAGSGIQTGCATVEATNRKQLILISGPQERQLGAEAYQQILSESKISNDEHMTQIVRRVGERIAAAADEPDFEWEFNLIESEQVNAFCLPGGKIAVYEGILPILQNEAAMAAVMGHEVAHAIARHGAERMSQHIAAAGIQKALEVGMRDSSPATRDAILQAFGMGAQVGVLLPYSRTHELEADQIGLILSARAGYEPTEAIGLWERMREASGKKPPEFMSTHPSEDRRIQQLSDQMSAAQEAYSATPEKHGIGATWGP